MFIRAAEYIQQLGSSEFQNNEHQETSKSTPEEVFEEMELKRKNLHLFCVYQTYKLTNYLECYCGTKINSMELEYAIDATNRVYLVHCSKVIWEPFLNDTYVLKQITFSDKALNGKTLYDLAEPENKRRQAALIEAVQEFIALNSVLEKRRKLINSNGNVQADIQLTKANFNLLSLEAKSKSTDMTAQRICLQEFKDWLSNQIAEEKNSRWYRMVLTGIRQKESEIMKAAANDSSKLKFKRLLKQSPNRSSITKSTSVQSLHIEAPLPVDVFK